MGAGSHGPVRTHCEQRFLFGPNSVVGRIDYLLSARSTRSSERTGEEVRTIMAKNTGHGHRSGAVKGRSEFKVGQTWYKRDTATGRILNGSPNEHKGVRNEK